jgi:type III secretion protein R
MQSGFPDIATIWTISAAFAVAPIAVVLLTSYTKILIVLHILRNALGLQQVPPGIVLNSMSLLLTVFIMYPFGQHFVSVLESAPASSVGGPWKQMEQKIEPIKKPLKEFLRAHSTAAERQFFATTAQRMNPAIANSISEDDFVVLAPAFTVSELTQAFYIGFLIFLPFLAIDIIVGNVLLALGMQMLSPTIISLPIKLLLFVALDGWSRLIHALVLTY